MRAAYYEAFNAPVQVCSLPDPAAGPDDVVLQVKATGLCRSDWHGWQGHDPDIHLPHVPGHEMAGVIVETGKNVKGFQKGQRVTLPFCEGCGTCPTCRQGQQQICDRYYQPGFTGWGSFAEWVRIPYADQNLVHLPDTVSFEAAAILGSRFITAWRGLLEQGRLQKGEWVAIHGCGGVGLSAVMIAACWGARPIAIDINENTLHKARALGAEYTLDARTTENIPAAIIDITKGGADLSIDALGSPATCRHSILCLRKQGRHVQLGLLLGKDADPPLPLSTVIAKELEIRGSHGMQAYKYNDIMKKITDGSLQPHQLIGQVVPLEKGVEELMRMGTAPTAGITVIRFE